MSALVFFLVFCQALGATIGVFTVLWGELAYLRALRDGKVNAAERIHLDTIAKGLRFGMSLLLIASLGLVIVAYVLHASLQPALTASYWTLMALALLIVSVSLALSRGRVSFALGSAVVFSGWWFLMYLTFGQLPALSFGAAGALYVVVVALFYALLHYARFFAQLTHKNTL